MKKVILVLVILCSVFVVNANASIFQKKNFYVSLRPNEVNLRTGPGTEYPVKYQYKLQGYPVKVLGEYENWYKIIDRDGDEGWVNKNLITKKRRVIILNGTQIMYSSGHMDSRPIYRLEENVVARFLKCKKEWCKIEVEDKKGWVEKEDLWGVE